jgi:hypothetical protein
MRSMFKLIQGKLNQRLATRAESAKGWVSSTDITGFSLRDVMAFTYEGLFRVLVWLPTNPPFKQERRPIRCQPGQATRSSMEYCPLCTLSTRAGHHDISLATTTALDTSSVSLIRVILWLTELLYSQISVVTGWVILVHLTRHRTANGYPYHSG